MDKPTEYDSNNKEQLWVWDLLELDPIPFNMKRFKRKVFGRLNTTQQEQRINRSSDCCADQSSNRDARCDVG
jgi:hypothetical protein